MTRRSRRTKRVKRSLTFNQRSRRKTRRVSRKGRKKVKRSRKRKRRTIKNKKGGSAEAPNRCRIFKDIPNAGNINIEGNYVGAQCVSDDNCRSCNCEYVMISDEKKCARNNDEKNISSDVIKEINKKMTWKNSPRAKLKTVIKKKQQARDQIAYLKERLAEEPPPGMDDQMGKSELSPPDDYPDDPNNPPLPRAAWGVNQKDPILDRGGGAAFDRSINITERRLNH